MLIVGRWDAYLVWALRTALRMSQEELGQHLEVADRFALLTRGNSLVLSDLVFSGSGNFTNRTQMLKTIALGGSGRIDNRLLDALHTRTARIDDAWDEFGPAVVLRPAMRHLGRLERLHSYGMTETQRRAQFPEPWTPLDCVRELDARLRAVA
jgi:hypothetical protein